MGGVVVVMGVEDMEAEDMGAVMVEVMEVVMEVVVVMVEVLDIVTWGE
jgi:hypothetical protein